MAESLRLDKFLWFARIVKTRALAQALAEQGRLRIGGRVVERPHAPVRAGDVLSFALRGRVRVIRILSLPARRGTPAEAAALYEEMEGGEGPPPGLAGWAGVDERGGARLGKAGPSGEALP